jgi:3-oxoacyl-[acyl-carrier-protein] synthase III
VIGIAKIAAYIPPGRVDNRARRGEFEVSDEFITAKIGVERVSRRDEGEDTADLCEKAFARLKDETPLDPTAIDCLVVVTQNPQGSGLPHTSAILHGRLGFSPRCACWDVSLGCSGFVHGIAIVQSFMAAHGLRHGLVFTADPYSKIVDPHDRNTAMIFGDGAAVALLSPASAETPLFTPLATLFHTEGGRYRALENRDGVLSMDGRAVFNFSATAVPRQIDELLAGLGLARADVDLYLLHQGSKYIVDAIRQRLGLPEERVPLALADHGNLVSSSIPVMLRSYLGRADIGRIVLSGFGVGLASASCVLERRP